MVAHLERVLATSSSGKKCVIARKCDTLPEPAHVLSHSPPSVLVLPILPSLVFLPVLLSRGSAYLFTRYSDTHHVSLISKINRGLTLGLVQQTGALQRQGSQGSGSLATAFYLASSRFSVNAVRASLKAFSEMCYARIRCLSSLLAEKRFMPEVGIATLELFEKLNVDAIYPF